MSLDAARKSACATSLSATSSATLRPDHPPSDAVSPQKASGALRRCLATLAFLRFPGFLRGSLYHAIDVALAQAAFFRHALDRIHVREALGFGCPHGIGEWHIVIHAGRALRRFADQYRELAFHRRPRGERRAD